MIHIYLKREKNYDNCKSSIRAAYCIYHVGGQKFTHKRKTIPKKKQSKQKQK